MIPNIRTNHCPHCKAQAGVIDAQAEVMAVLRADKAKLRQALRKAIKYANDYATDTGALYNAAMNEAEAALQETGQ